MISTVVPAGGALAEVAVTLSKGLSRIGGAVQAHPGLTCNVQE